MVLMDEVESRLAEALLDGDPDTSPFDAIRKYIRGQVFGRPSSFFFQIYVIIGLCCFVFLALMAGFIVRFRYSTVKPILRDGRLSRFDPRYLIPLIWVFYSGFTISMSASMLLGYKGEYFSPYAKFVQIFNPTLLAICGHVVFVNLAAKSPAMRKFLNARVSPSSRFRWREWFIAVVTALPIAIIIGVIVHAAASFVGDLKEVTVLYDICMQHLDLIQPTGSIALLVPYYPTAVELLRRVDSAFEVLAFAGRFYTAFLVFWLLVGGFLYSALDYSVLRHIKQLEAPQDVDIESKVPSPHLADTPTFLISVLDGRKISNASEKFAAMQVPKDRPFGNLEQPSNMPGRYQAVLDTPREQNSEKAKKLRSLLWRDRWNTSCTAAIILGFLSQSIFEAIGGHNHIAGVQALPIFYLWQSWAFIITSVPVTMLFLLDSIRLATYAKKRDKDQVWLPLAGLTIGPELPIPAKMKDEHEAADQSMNNVRGIVVSQVAIMTIDEEDPLYAYAKGRRKSFPLLK